MKQPILEQLKAAYAASTQGEWHGCHDGNCICGTISSYEKDFMIARTELNHYEDAPQNVPKEVITANAKFIFIAHNSLPAVFEYIAALEARLAALEASQATQQPETIEWPESPLVCHCGVGFQGDGWYCGECGGGRF